MTTRNGVNKKHKKYLQEIKEYAQVIHNRTTKSLIIEGFEPKSAIESEAKERSIENKIEHSQMEEPTKESTNDRKDRDIEQSKNSESTTVVD